MESKKKQILKEDNVCMLCLENGVENHNRVFNLNKKLSETISDVLYIKIENIIKLPKRICYRCFFIIEYMRDFRNVTIRNITVAENKLTEDNSSVIYDKPLIFNIISDKVLKEENIPLNLDVTEYIEREMQEKNNDVLLVPQSYKHASSYEQEVLPYKQSIFQCSSCPNTYNKKTGLVHHERKHKRQERRERIRSTLSRRSKKFTCEDCDNQTVYSTVTELRTHKKSHVSSYFCRMGCGAEFNAHFERDYHESTCNERLSENDLEQPGVCTRSRSRLSSLSRSRCSSVDFSHLEDSWESESAKTVRSNKSKSKIPYTRSCNSCDSDHSVKTNHTSKQNLSTSSHKKLLSNGYESPHSRPSRSNKRKQLSDTESNTENNIIQGFQPKNTVEGMYYIKNHEQPYESTRKFRCTKCKFSNNNVDTVSQHETKRHKIQAWFPCSECRKAFTNKQLLDHHRSISHFDGPFICNVCSEVHTSQQNLQAHLYDHRFSINEECGACDKKFLTTEQLRVHVDGETDERHTIYKLALIQFALDQPSNDELDDNLFKIIDVVSLNSSRPNTPFTDNDNEDTEDSSANEQSIFNENIIQNDRIQTKHNFIIKTIDSDKSL